MPSHRVGDVAFAVVLALIIAGSLNVAIFPAHVGSPSAGTVRAFAGGSLPSWNPNVACAAALVGVRDVLGSAYPNQALIGSRYQTNSKAGGVPNKRQLLAPCTITNVTGQNVPSFVEIHGVYLNPYTFDSNDCSHGFAPINGGTVYPDGKLYCDNVGDILSVGTVSGKIHIEFDQDWLAKGWCGSQTTWCNNVSAAEYVSLGSISLDVQGFVYWDDTHWEVHPLTAMRLSAGFTVSADPTSLEIPRNYTTRANVRVLGASTDPVALSLSGCPSATVCTLSPASGSPIFASSLRVNTSASSPRGTFNLVIGATNASLSRHVTVPLTIGDRVLSTFHRGDGGLFSETDDTYISSGAANTNFGKDQTLQVDGTCDVAGIVCKALVKFPLIVGPGDGQIPATSTIVSATLVLFIQNQGDPETLYQVTEPWTESGATWNSFATPGVPGNRGAEFQITPKPINTFPSINITAIAQRWVNGDVNQGILLASTLPDGTLYNSSESNAGRPTLRVEFVPPPFDFSLSSSPSSGFASYRGGSVSATVTALRTFGPTHTVQYSCTNLPSGTTCAFTPPSCNATCAANLVIATSSSTPAGTYSVSVQATDGTITRTSGFTLTVGDPLLAYDMQTLTGAGLMKDLSSHGNDGTIMGTTDIAGKVGQARHFNAGDRLTAPAISVPATDFTVAAWFRWTTNPSPYYSGIQGGGGSWELRLMADGRFGATFYQSIGPDVFTEIVSSLAYNDGDWHHAAAVLRSGLVRLYVDGVLVAQDTTNPITSVRTSTQTIIGRVASDFAGDIDEVFVYGRALGDAEIAALAPPPPATGPVLQYDMQTLLLDGRMKDLSGHVNHGTITGTTDVAGKVGQARHFNAGDRITAPAVSVPATDFTVAAWFRWTTNPSPYYSGIHGGGGSWELRVMADGRFGATFYQSIGPDVFTEIVSPLAYNDGDWHHAASVLRNGLVELYVDGALVARDTTNPITSVRTSTQTIIGRVASDFAGDIDEVFVYGRALGDAEIAALAPPPPATGPVLQYDMETLLPDGRMKDLSGHANHGTLSGSTDVAGKVGRARHFNAGDRITAPAISVPATDFTVAAWFRWTTNPSPYYSGIHGGGGSWELRVMADGRLGATFYQSIGPDVFTEIVSPLAYNDGTWHHAAAVLRSGLVRLYVDGILVAQDTTNPITSVRTSTQTIVGRVASDFVGDIDEVLVYGRALTDAEIAAIASGSTSNVQYFGATLPSGAAGTFTEPSCSPTHSARFTTVASASPLKGRYAVILTASDHSISRSPAFSMNVAGTYGVSFRTGNGGYYSSQTEGAYLSDEHRTATSVPIRFSTLTRSPVAARGSGLVE